ncbi:MAG: hypothetical protein ACOY0T_15815 [Myxococcota bacterium]
MTTIGDLGCLGVDVDEWRRLNRVPLYPGKMNRWILARTLRDDPTPDDVKSTLAAVFMKWFEGTLLDPALTYHDTTRSGTADLVKLERVSRERLMFPNTVRRREELPGVMPMLRAGPFVWLEVSFAYRGQQTDMPWPVRTGAMVQLESSAQCPLDADWILDSVATPTENAPVELSSTDKLLALLGEKGAELKKPLEDMALWAALIVGGALLTLLLARRN